jgi:hypothetical protein
MTVNKTCLRWVLSMFRKSPLASALGFVVIMFAALALSGASGCGGSKPSDGALTEEQGADQKKIQELANQGYDFAEIRAIMKGEKVPPKPKKKAGSTKR